MNRQQKFTLLAAMLVTLIGGSIHAFSVYLIPLEQILELPRAQVSLFYSLALVCLTLSVLLGYKIYDFFSPATMIVGASICAGGGLTLASMGESWTTIFIGYSLISGTANGIGYGYVLQLVGRVLPDFKAFSMAAVTAAYAIGATLFSLILAKLIQFYSLAFALNVLALCFILSGIVSGTIMKLLGVIYTVTGDVKSAATSGRSNIGLLWISYGASVFAGLMAIGHAAGIVESVGGQYSVAIWGAIFIGVGSALGGFMVGWRINQSNFSQYLIGLPISSAIFLLMLVAATNPTSAIILLALIGFSYGSIIAVYPYAVAVYYGDVAGPKIYGQVFTAWGFAGLTGPWVAGKLFDISQQYALPLIIAAAFAVISALVMWVISRKFVESHHYVG
jgi:OFA family oxalate/formate antiporter-like MFS transporter